MADKPDSNAHFNSPSFPWDHRVGDPPPTNPWPPVPLPWQGPTWPGTPWPQTPPFPQPAPTFPKVKTFSSPPRPPKPAAHKDGDPMDVKVEGDVLRIGPVTIGFQRTLRLPDDGRDYPLPPSMGHFPIRRVADYADKVPASWRAHGGVFLPMYQREAMWLHFGGQWHRPNAVKVGVGKVNALSGKPWTENLTAGRGDDEQDYMVVPEQPWLDGINAGDGTVKQFVAMQLGMGYTVEGQVTGEEEHGGIQLCVYEPKAGRFPDAPPAPRHGILRSANAFGSMSLACAAPAGGMLLACEEPDGAEMGLAAGGSMRQEIYADSHGVDTWDVANHARVFVHIVNSDMWQRITGEAPPSTPVTAKAYTDNELPWFDLYDEDKTGIAPSKELAKVKSVKDKDAEHGFTGLQDDTTVDVPDSQVTKYQLPPPAPLGPGHVPDGDW